MSIRTFKVRTFKDPSMQKMYIGCRMFGADKSSNFYLANGLPHRGASHRAAYWNGRGGRRQALYGRNRLVYAAWAAGQDDLKDFGPVSGWDIDHQDMPRGDPAGAVDATPAAEGETEESKTPSLAAPREPQPKPGPNALKKQSDMTHLAYRRALKSLGLTPNNAGPHLGISRATSMRCAAGSHPIPKTLALLIRALVKLASLPRGGEHT